MANTWKPKKPVICLKCGWTGKRAFIGRECPKCGGWHPVLQYPNQPNREDRVQ